LLRRRIGGEVGLSVDDGTGAFAELTLGDVNLRGAADGSSAVDRFEVPVVACILNVDVALDVRAAGRLVVVAVLVRANVDVYALTTVVLLGLVMTMLAWMDVDVDSLTAVVLLRLAITMLTGVDVYTLSSAVLLGLLVGADGRRAAGFEDLDFFGVGFAALSRLDVEGEVFLVIVTLPPCLW
jgi:hypothetical protein